MKNKIFYQANQLLEHLKQKKHSCLVSTNGCFDILHAGHVDYLEASKTLGDALIVFVNNDPSVRKLNKGSQRPINNETDRMRVLSALECVDYVCLFGEDTPIESLKLIRPQIHTKGGDYTADTLPETKIIQSWGGRIEIIPLTKGKSTTNLIQQITQGKN